MRRYLSRSSDGNPAAMQQSESLHLLLQKQASHSNGDYLPIQLEAVTRQGGRNHSDGGAARAAGVLSETLGRHERVSELPAVVANGGQSASAARAKDMAAGAPPVAISDSGGDEDDDRSSCGCSAAAADENAYDDDNNHGVQEPSASRCSAADRSYSAAYSHSRRSNSRDGGAAAACSCCDPFSRCRADRGGSGSTAIATAAAAAADASGSLVLSRLLSIGAKLSNDPKREGAGVDRGRQTADVEGGRRNGEVLIAATVRKSTAAEATAANAHGDGRRQRRRPFAPFIALRDSFACGFLRRRRRRRHRAASGGGGDKYMSMSSVRVTPESEAAPAASRAGDGSGGTGVHAALALPGSDRRRPSGQMGAVATAAVAAALGHGVAGGRRRFVFDPAARGSHYWNGVVSLAFLYNFWVIGYRYAFDEVSANNYRLWLTLDYLADGVYALDVFKRLRTAYLDEGVLQTQPAKMRARYMNSTAFYMDCLCLLPLDFLYLSVGFNSLLRLFRVLKVYRFWSFLDQVERHARYPNVVRSLSVLHYLLAIFHWNACILHALVRSESVSSPASVAPAGDGLIASSASYSIVATTAAITAAATAPISAAPAVAAASLASDWLPPAGAAELGNGTLASYVSALHWAVVVLTTTGGLPQPETLRQYAYSIALMIFSLLLFAAVLGTVANIISSVGAARKDFQAKLDEVKTYMRQYGLPVELQERVIQWFEYLWASKGQVRDGSPLELLPERLKAEICIHVHLDTLKKVEIFQNTEAGFLKELVLRLRPALFSPGDYVCRKGEVGKEMYIVKKGVLDVLDASGRPVARLVAGSYFGEISILNMGEVGNRRTASVRSVGYSDLFCLDKKDLWDVLKEYPAARFRLEEIAMQRLLSKGKPPPPLRRSGGGGRGCRSGDGTGGGGASCRAAAASAGSAAGSSRPLSASSELRTATADVDDEDFQAKAPISRCHSTPGAVERSSLVPHEDMVLPEVRICVEDERRVDSSRCASPSPFPLPIAPPIPTSRRGSAATYGPGMTSGHLACGGPLIASTSLLQPPTYASWSALDAFGRHCGGGETGCAARLRGQGLPRAVSSHAAMVSMEYAAAVAASADDPGRLLPIAQPSGGATALRAAEEDSARALPNASAAWLAPVQQRQQQQHRQQQQQQQLLLPYHQHASARWRQQPCPAGTSTACGSGGGGRALSGCSSMTTETCCLTMSADSCGEGASSACSFALHYDSPEAAGASPHALPLHQPPPRSDCFAAPAADYYGLMRYEPPPPPPPPQQQQQLEQQHLERAEISALRRRVFHLEKENSCLRSQVRCQQQDDAMGNRGGAGDDGGVGS